MTTWAEQFPDLADAIDKQIDDAIKADRKQMCERLIGMVENDGKLGRWTVEIVTDIIRSNYTPVCIGEL